MTPDSLQWPYLIGGLILGLFGWLLYWAGIPIIGGIVGASAGGALALIIHDLVQANIDPNVFLGVGVVLGAIVGVLLMRKIQTYFFFIVGACLGGAAAWQALRHQLPHGQAMTPDLKMSLIVLGCALLGGFVMVYFRRFIVALGTSLMGALLVTYSIPQQYKLLGGLICLAVFVAVQIGLVRRFVEQEAFDHRMRAASRRAKYYEDETEE